MDYKFTTADKKQLKEKGISLDKVTEQLHYFKKGFPSLHIQKPATVGNGILQIDKIHRASFIAKWESYSKTNKIITKFVPASGAATRMFKDLFAFLESTSLQPTTDFEKFFFHNIRSFAFFDVLDKKCSELYNKDIEELLGANRYKDIVKALLYEEGLNYGELPKGLLLFHSYAHEKRTPLEEHLVEGALYAKDAKGRVKVHFTISPQHQELFEETLEAKRENLEQETDSKFDVSFSIQKPSTDTIAVDLDNNPFRDQGELLFRPGGHGALIENLNDLDSDIVFVKNIDNVVPDKYKESEALYKKMLAGVLVSAQQRIFNYLEALYNDKYNADVLSEIQNFLETDLYTTATDEITGNNQEQLVSYLIQKLNRPIRVCGMVRNEGEPGGGPFIVENNDGSYSPHILEGSQIDEKTASALSNKATHFNPVDLVCGIKDSKGEKFNLLLFVDKDTGFISSKSQSGRPLKALELPGLWNGAMSDWNTIFVEVPISTFNPVKTVNDLLREEHQ